MSEANGVEKLNSVKDCTAHEGTVVSFTSPECPLCTKPPAQAVPQVGNICGGVVNVGLAVCRLVELGCGIAAPNQVVAESGEFKQMLSQLSQGVSVVKAAVNGGERRIVTL